MFGTRENCFPRTVLPARLDRIEEYQYYLLRDLMVYKAIYCTTCSIVARNLNQ